MFNVSIIIRTMNEKEELSNLIDILHRQDYRGKKEVIVIDNESSDGTPELAQKRGAKVLTIKREYFCFPRALNMGVDAAKGEIIVSLVGHALPFREDWLRIGVEYFHDSLVAGVYSLIAPSRKHNTFPELMFYTPPYIWTKLKGPYSIRHAGMGVFGATNSTFRKELWLQHPFEEKYQLGGGDTKWAEWALANGYKIICDYRFAVNHSHRLNWEGLIRQCKYWYELNNPTVFDQKKLSFRKDLKFNPKPRR